MSYQSRSAWKTSTDGSFTPGSDKWTGLEVENAFLNLGDSVAWESQKVVMGSNTYDCNSGNLQERTLSANGSLTITNAEAGKYYVLIKKGSFTLGLPSGHFTADAATVPAGTYVVTFLYDGTNYFFNYSSYAAT